MPVLQKIITCMEQCGYVVQVKLVNMHGWVPQRRRRVYVVAIRSDAYVREFRWPVASEKKLSFSKTIGFEPGQHQEPHLACELPAVHSGPKKTIQRQRTIMAGAFSKAFARGFDPRRRPLFVDIDASDKYKTAGEDVLPTLTAARGQAGGPWCSVTNSRLSIQQLCQAQGYFKGEVPWEAAKVKKAQIGKMLGNAVTGHFFSALMVQVFQSAGLMDTQ